MITIDTFHETLEKFESTATIEKLPVNSLQIDRAYQRTTSPIKVKQIANNFNSLAASTLVVSRRNNGDLFVMDGQHRLEAMKKRDVVYADCKIGHGLIPQQEAQIFVMCNTSRKNPSALETFKARIYGGDEKAIAVQECVKNQQLVIAATVGESKKAFVIKAVSALEQIYDRGGVELLSYILGLVRECWFDDVHAFDEKVLLGTTAFHSRYSGIYDKKDFITKMKTRPLARLLGEATIYGGVGIAEVGAFAKALQLYYDKGRTSRRLEKKGE